MYSFKNAPPRKHASAVYESLGGNKRLVNFGFRINSKGNA